MSDTAAVNGLDWTRPQAAIVQRLRNVLMPTGQQALVRRMGVARDLAAIKEPDLAPPEVYVIYTRPLLLEATAQTARYRHQFSIVTIVRQEVAAQQQRAAAVVDLGDQLLHEAAVPIVLTISQALHGWRPDVVGFGALVPDQPPPVGYSDLGNAFVTLRYGCEASSHAQPGVNPMAGRPR